MEGLILGSCIQEEAKQDGLNKLDSESCLITNGLGNEVSSDVLLRANESLLWQVRNSLSRKCGNYQSREPAN